MLRAASCQFTVRRFLSAKSALRILFNLIQTASPGGAACFNHCLAADKKHTIRFFDASVAPGMSAAAAAVAALLGAVGHNDPLDHEIMEYICSIVEDPDPESSLDVLVGVLSECVEPFAACSSEQQAQLVLQLLDDVKPRVDDVASPAHVAGEDSSVQAVVAALRQAKLESQELPDACADITNTRGVSGSRTSSSDSSSNTSDVGALLDLCPPGISSGFLQHNLQHTFHQDMQAAANWLLEVEPAQLRRQQAAWEQEQQQAEQQRQDNELEKNRQKKLIVEKFDLRVVSDSSCGSKKGGRQGQADLLQMPKKGSSQDSKLRYRDGRVVSTKGEKVIVEKVGEDWDGGSRGKVYTKGKRGKGFQ